MVPSSREPDDVTLPSAAVDHRVASAFDGICSLALNLSLSPPPPP